MRLSSTQLLGLLFASCSPDDLITRVVEGVESEGSGFRRRKRKKRAKGAEDVAEKSTSPSHYLLQDTVNKVKKQHCYSNVGQHM